MCSSRRSMLREVCSVWAITAVWIYWASWMQANIVVIGLGIVVVLATFKWLRGQQGTVLASGGGGQMTTGTRKEENPDERKPLLQAEV